MEMEILVCFCLCKQKVGLRPRTAEFIDIQDSASCPSGPDEGWTWVNTHRVDGSNQGQNRT